MCARPASPYTCGVDANTRPRLNSRVPLLAGILLAGIVLVLVTVGVDGPVAFVSVLLAAIAGALGVLVWAARRMRHQRDDFESELTGWAQAQAAQAERLRLARDLHDLASHGLGLMTVRAAAARATVTGTSGALPAGCQTECAAAQAECLTALGDIEDLGRQATTELRRMLTVLRTEGADRPYRPVESVADIAQIVADAERAGLLCTLEIDDLATTSASTQLAVCQVVREGLNNVARHAGPVRAMVTIRRCPDGISVLITDNGPACGWQQQPGVGAGLAGLAERLEAIGGSIQTGCDDGGFRLEATIPT